MNTKKIALTGGIYLSAITAFSTVASLLNIPGFPQFTKILVDIYGPWGYSISITGIFVGAIWGFIEGFVHFGIFGFIYSRLRR